MSDSGDESRTLSKTHVIGPLKAAKAEDVAEVIREVYRDAMNSNSPTATGRGGGFFPFGGMPPTQRLTDANGNPRPAALTVSANEATNTVVVHCSDSLFKDVDQLVQQLERAASGSPRSIRVVSVAGIDPVQLQQALEFLVELVHRLRTRLLGGGIKLHVRRRLLRIGLVRRLLAALALLGPGLHRLDLLEHGILLELLLHHRLQLQHRRLQQRQRLLELRRQHHLLRHALREVKAL